MPDNAVVTEPNKLRGGRSLAIHGHRRANANSLLPSWRRRVSAADWVRRISVSSECRRTPCWIFSRHKIEAFGLTRQSWLILMVIGRGDGLDILVTLVDKSRGELVAHTECQPMPTDIAKYSIEIFKRGGEGAGIEEILDRHADLKVARSIYRARVEQYPLLKAMPSLALSRRSASTALLILVSAPVYADRGTQTSLRENRLVYVILAEDRLVLAEAANTTLDTFAAPADDVRHP